MGTILIDKLLSACVEQGASDLHFAAGRAPTISIHGRSRLLAFKMLDAADIAAVVEGITPERCHEELQQRGRTTFRFGFGDRARVRACVGWQDGNVAVQLQLS